MKILTLIENNSLDERFCAEHGLSLGVEANDHRYLFDTGMSGQFLQNAALLNFDLSAVNAVFISHAHYDHTGGLPSFFGINVNAPVYIHKEAFHEFFAKRPNGSFEDIGLHLPKENLDRIILTEGTITPYDDVTIFSDIKTNEFHSEANDVLLEKIYGHYVPDLFRHEQNFLIRTESNHLVLITGCSHSGIVNIINRASEKAGRTPDAVIGGFHLMNPSAQQMIKAQTVDAISERLLSLPIKKYYTGHCTGQDAFERMRGIMGSRLDTISAGTVFEID